MLSYKVVRGDMCERLGLFWLAGLLCTLTLGNKKRKVYMYVYVKREKDSWGPALVLTE